MITAFVDTSYVLSKESKTFHSSAPRALKERNILQVVTVPQLCVTNSTEQSPSWKANQFSASQEIPTLYGTWIVITIFIVAPCIL